MPVLCSSAAVVSLTAGGTIAAVSRWQGSADKTKSDFAFEFQVTSTGPGVAVESKVQIIKLVNVASYPSTVGVSIPKNCTIGGTVKVEDRHVKFVAGSTQIDEGESFQISSDGNQTFKIRLSAEGNYGSASGEVVCASNGGLNYSY